MAERTAKYKVVKDKLSVRVRICKLLGRERGELLRDGKVIEVTKEELDLLKRNSWVTLNKDKKNEVIK